MTGGPLALLTAFAAVDVVLCLTPGPAVLFVVTQALGHGVARSVWATVGVVAGDALYLALSACGLGALLLAKPAVFRVVQYAGAAYLAALGIATYRGRGVATGAPVGHQVAVLDILSMAIRPVRARTRRALEDAVSTLARTSVCKATLPRGGRRPATSYRTACSGQVP